MIDITTIKLIIWDLDDTLWAGTLSEGGMRMPDSHKQLICNLTDAGIINSICSKNDLEPTKQELIKLGIWDYFVFPSINWDSKGLRIKSIIDQIALRPVNVLFIDDNTFNLHEAQHVLPDLQIALPDEIPSLIAQLVNIPKKDQAHKRLHQYKILEEKATAAKSFNSNEEFLYSSNIRVDIHRDCSNELDRIHELIMRSNQLNYTKKRISIEELNDLLHNPQYDCGYVTAKDNYGDYGLIGFFANGRGGLEHYLFSCRTMGQLIEQYVYAQLEFPELQVVGEVRTQLNKTDCPGWINQAKASEVSQNNTDSYTCKILLKGPCDLSNSQSYIRTKEQIVTEFTYVKGVSGQVIDTHNHSLHIRALHEYTDAMNKEMISDCSFVDPEMLNGTFFTGDYDVIFLSSLIESVYPIYQKKGSTLQVVYRKSVDSESDNRFFDNYEYIGLTSPAQYKQFLTDCLNWLPKKTTLCIILGVSNALKGFEDTALRHQSINSVVKEVAKENSRLRYIDVDQFVISEEDITDGINHYQTRVYYEIAQEMICVIKDVTGNSSVRSVDAKMVRFDQWIKRIKRVLTKHLHPNGLIYKLLKKVYLCISRRKDNTK